MHADAAVKEDRDRITAVLTRIRPLEWTQHMHELVLPGIPLIYIGPGSKAKIPRVRPEARRSAQIAHVPTAVAVILGQQGP